MSKLDTSAGSFEPIAALAGAGAVKYTPQRRPAACGFGPWEVHPHRAMVVNDGTAALEWNGQYLAVGVLLDDDGHPRPYQLEVLGVPPFVEPEGMSARALAERICVARNGGKPTRVVDHYGHEHVSSHTIASIQAEQARAAKRDSARQVPGP